MAEGEAGAVFEGLANDAGDAAGEITDSLAKLSEDAADKEEANLARLLEQDAKAGKDIEDAGKPGEPSGPVSVPGPPAGMPGSLEGLRNTDIYDPADCGRRITDIDHVDGGVLWEEKRATWAQDPATWPDKHLTAKFDKYLEARQHMPGYENAPIGLRMTSPKVEPALRASIENAIRAWQAAHPQVDVRLEFAE
jgi:hypothetical protein